MSTLECAFFGTLGKEAERRTSKNGKAYLKFSVRTGDGDHAQWIGVMLFGDDVHDLAPKLVKGSRVYCEGSLRLDIWQQQDGKQRAGLSCVSWHCRVSAIGRGKPKRNTRAASRGATSGDGFYSDEISL